ncbi:MAG: Transmembrane exosortase (Exosortase_EpsH) [Candidatus Udaeobacter sp.]|nr:MAG: Transmembrane exosortase (Exosortase_EpsH) [Candidatus Udaeobacter sp.]
MRSSPNGAAAREPTIPVQTGNISRSALLKQRQKPSVVGLACFAIVLAAVFGPSLLTLINYAAASNLYSYILLIPFVSAYLLYIRRDQLPKKCSIDLPLAIVSLAIGLGSLTFTYWLDFAGRAPAIGDRLTLLTTSFLCCLAAGGFFFFGRDWMRAAAFPLAYLIFMVPMPDAMADALESASKYASAEVANVLFHLSGTPILRAGRVFQLPNITIEVAQECSGIRSSWVLFMTSILAANLFLKTSWRRIVLVAFVIPLAMLRNGFRILVIGLLCVNLGPQMIHSVIHRRGGPVFFVLSLIPLLLLLWWLRKGEIRVRPAESRSAS